MKKRNLENAGKGRNEINGGKKKERKKESEIEL
jgi:hypothetical protein